MQSLRMAIAALALGAPTVAPTKPRRPDLDVITNPDPQRVGARSKARKMRRSIELKVHGKTTIKRFVRHLPDPGRAEELRAAHLEWKAAMARRSIERLSPHDEQNVEGSRILRRRDADGRARNSK